MAVIPLRVHRMKKKLEKLTENLFPVSEAAGSDEFEEDTEDE